MVEANATDRLKKYVADFKEEMKDYLATRKPSTKPY